MNMRPQVRELVINWHITEACNYRCRYCYAKWAAKGKELIHNVSGSEALLCEIARFFSPHNLQNPLREYINWTRLRLNIAGGEPLLYQDAVQRIISFARQLDMRTSLITNGSHLSTSLARSLGSNLSMLGISLDSAKVLTNQAIGREDRRAGLLNLQSLPEVLAALRASNPEITLKLNTVVNALNCHEEMSTLIRSIAPTRWKVLRMLPVVTKDLAVSDAEFASFVARHASFSDVMCAEDNVDMRESYLMIDPHGRFFQNGSGRNDYLYSHPIHEVGADRSFSEIGLSASKFCARYTTGAMANAA